MGASNFHTVNARNVYAVLMNYESEVLDDDGNETDETETVYPDSDDVDDYISNLICEAKEYASLNGISFHLNCDSDPHELRSYPSNSMFQFYKFKKYGDINLTVNINCLMRSGYYQGATLDWHITYDLGNNILDEINFMNDIEYMSDMPEGMRKIQCKNAEIWAKEISDHLVDLTEEFFKINSMPLAVTARFSNGETVYQKI